MNIYDLPSIPVLQELSTTLIDKHSVRIERIISTNHVSGWYDQDEYEYVILLDGNSEIAYEDGRVVHFSKGDTILLSPHERYRIVYTSTEPPCIWLCVFWR